MFRRGDEGGADLFVGEEFNGSVWEDTEKSGRVALVQAPGAFIPLDVVNRS